MAEMVSPALIAATAGTKAAHNASAKERNTEGAPSAFAGELNRRMEGSTKEADKASVGAPGKQTSSAERSDSKEGAPPQAQAQESQAASQPNSQTQASPQADQQAAPTSPAGLPPELAGLLASLAAQNSKPSQTPAPMPEAETSAARTDLFATIAGNGSDARAQRDEREAFLAGISSPSGNAVKFADSRTLLAEEAEQPGMGAQGKALPPKEGGAVQGFAATLGGLLHAGNPHAPATAAAPIPVEVPTPAGQPGWAEDVGNRVAWAIGRGESQAELVLTPAHLGKVEVTITVNGDQTNAQFVAASPAARDMLEQALPRLREMFAGAGINLGQASVGTSGQSGNQGEGSSGGRFGQGRRGIDSSVSATAPSRWVQQGVGLVDTFA